MKKKTLWSGDVPGHSPENRNICYFGSPPAPSPPPPPPPPPPMPIIDDVMVNKEKKKAAARVTARSGRQSTILSEDSGIDTLG